MTPLRIAFRLAVLCTVGGGIYLGQMGIGGDSTGLDRSIRAGSAGNSFANANVK